MNTWNQFTEEQREQIRAGIVELFGDRKPSMLLLDAELTPLSPRAELEAWRRRLLELKATHPDPANQVAIMEALAHVNAWLHAPVRTAR